MTALEEAAIRARLEAATPGPWSAHGSSVWAKPSEEFVAERCYEADAEFIAHARADVERLLEALALQRHETSLVREARGEAMAEVEHWQTRASAAESALGAVRDEHPMLTGCDCDRGCGCPPGGPEPRCIECRTPWPCRTIAAIDALATPTTPEQTQP